MGTPGSDDLPNPTSRSGSNTLSAVPTLRLQPPSSPAVTIAPRERPTVSVGSSATTARALPVDPLRRTRGSTGRQAPLTMDASRTPSSTGARQAPDESAKGSVSPPPKRSKPFLPLGERSSNPTGSTAPERKRATYSDALIKAQKGVSKSSSFHMPFELPSRGAAE